MAKTMIVLALWEPLVLMVTMIIVLALVLVWKNLQMAPLQYYETTHPTKVLVLETLTRANTVSMVLYTRMVHIS